MLKTSGRASAKPPAASVNREGELRRTWAGAIAELVRRTSEETGVTVRELSRRSGHDAAYLGHMAKVGACPNVGTAAAIVEACGYRLAIVPAGKGRDGA